MAIFLVAAAFALLAIVLLAPLMLPGALIALVIYAVVRFVRREVRSAEAHWHGLHSH